MFAARAHNARQIGHRRKCTRLDRQRKWEAGRGRGKERGCSCVKIVHRYYSHGSWERYQRQAPNDGYVCVYDILRNTPVCATWVCEKLPPIEVRGWKADLEYIGLNGAFKMINTSKAREVCSHHPSTRGGETMRPQTGNARKLIYTLGLGYPGTGKPLD